MIGLGTIINCGSVLAGASVGMLLKNGLSKRFEDTIMQGIGLCTMFIGIGGALFFAVLPRTLKGKNLSI